MEPHATRVVVWDTPSAVEGGAPFRLRVGVKCTAECHAPWRVEIRDTDGRSVAAAVVGREPWPGTAALYYADLELRAPLVEGLHEWEACVAAVGDEAVGNPGHAAAGARFRVRTVPAPECTLKVLAVDASSGAPVPGAKVVVHPYRATTDAHGVAELRVPKGAYRLFVSGRDRFPFRGDGEISADTLVRAELDLDLGPSDAELWV